MTGETLTEMLAKLDGLFETERQEAEFQALTGLEQKARYYELRKKGRSHSLALMLASRKGPPGYIK